MLNLYKVLRLFVLGIVIILLGIIVFLEVSFKGPADWVTQIQDQAFYTNYQRFHRVLWYDPYTEKTLSTKSEYITELTNVISSRVEAMRSFAVDKYFNEQLFSFYISQQIDDIKTLSEKYFLRFADFRDLVIIDNEKNLIFKYGIEDFSVQYYPVSNTIDGLYFADKIGLIYNSDDPTLEYEYQIIALFDYSEFNAILQDMSAPGFVLLKDRLMRNQQFPRSVFKSHRENLDKEPRRRYGMKILEVLPLMAGNTRMGYMGILYPVRSIGSYLVFILKLGALLLAGILLYLLDKWIYSAVSDREIIKEESRVLQPDSELEDENDKEVTDENLDWVENFIEETEWKK